VARGKWCAKSVWGVVEGSTEVSSPLGDEEALLVADKVGVGILKIEVGRVSVSEGVPKLGVEDFAFFVIPSVHGGRT
jgi:hypothetical protein